MMRWLVSSSMQFRLLVLVAAGVIVFFGVRQLRDAQVDMLPEFAPPFVEIQTEALGLSAAEVESLITGPLEADMLSGMPWCKEMRSESIPGLSSIVIVFEPGTNVLDARQMVQERLVSVHALPQVSKPPVMINPKSSSARIMNVGLSSTGKGDEKALSPVEMSVLARWTIRPRLMGIPGVANVSIWGQRKRQLQVLIDPEKLAEKNITMHQIISTTGNSLWVSPLSFLDASTPGTGGWIETPNQRLGVRHMLPISTPEELAQVPVDGTDLKLGDVATVVETHQPMIGDAIINDQSNLMLVIEKFPEANTAEVTHDVEKALHSLSQGLAGLDMDTTLYRPATQIETARSNMIGMGIFAGILMAAGLLLLMFNWRTALISVASIGIALLATVLVLNLMNATLNTLMLAGVALALVVMIDDTIISVENIARRLRTRHPQQSTVDVILEASLELRTAALYATVIVALLVGPLFFMNGVYGAFFQAIALPYLVAIIVSMLTALCVTSVLSMVLLSGQRASGEPTPPSRLMGRLNDRICSGLSASPGGVLMGICIVLALGVVAATQLKRDDMLPKFQERDVAIHFDAVAGTSHPAMTRIVRQATKDLKDIPGVRKVSAHVGRAEMSDEIANVNSTEMWVNIEPSADYDSTIAAIQTVVDGYPGLERETINFSAESIADVLDDEPTELTVRVYGDEYGVLRQKAAQVAAMMRNVHGILDPEVDNPGQEPSVEIKVDMEKAKEFGLKPGDVRRAATALLSGIQVGNLFEEQKVFDVIVWGIPEVRNSLTSVQDLVIDTPTGEFVKLSDVADINIVPAETVIQRDTVARYIDVSAHVYGNDYSVIAGDINRGLTKIDFPLEYRAELLDGYANHQESKRRVAGISVAALVMIYLLLQAAFGSWRLATAVLLTIPMALAGGVIALWATGSVVTLGVMAGFVALLAIAVRNTMITVAHYQGLEKVEGAGYENEVIARGTSERFVPVMMSTLITALAMLPVLYYGSIAGMELLYPMAIVILGGLVTTTAYSLVAVPAVYALFSLDASHVDERDLVVDGPAVYGGHELNPTP